MLGEPSSIIAPPLTSEGWSARTVGVFLAAPVPCPRGGCGPGAPRFPDGYSATLHASATIAGGCATITSYQRDSPWGRCAFRARASLSVPALYGLCLSATSGPVVSARATLPDSAPGEVVINFAIVSALLFGSRTPAISDSACLRTARGVANPGFQRRAA